MKFLIFWAFLFSLLIGADSIAGLLKQSTSRNITFFMVDATDSVTGKTGLTVTCTLSKDAGTFNASGGSVTEISSGWYYLAANTTDTGTPGDLAGHCTATGADPTDWKEQIVADLPGATVSSVTGSVASVTGAVGSVTGNVGGNVVGSVASVTGAVGSVTGAVGSVTGNVGGNVVGSVASVTGAVGSVTGAVGSVTGNVGGNVVGSVASVSGAAGSVTGAVGSVTGNVGGNIVGTVSSVTGNVGGNVVGSVASVTNAVTVGTNNDKTGYSLAAASLPIKKNTALNNFDFPIYGTSATIPTTGLTVNCQRSIDGASFASCTNSVSEIGTTGYYKINFSAADLNGDTVAVRLYGTGVKEKSITFITQ